MKEVKGGYKNILVNALVNLGDVVLTTSGLSLLRKAYPNAKITMLVRPVVKDVIENSPVVDEVIIFDYKAKENSWQKMLGMVREIRERKFDLSISFDRKLRPALLSWLAGIPVRVGPDKVFDDNKSKVTWLYNRIIPIKHDLANTLQGETYQEIIRGFTGLIEHSKPAIAPTTEAHREYAKELLGYIPKGKIKIPLCVKGTFALKTWPKEYFAQVVAELRKKYDAAFFVVGAPEDRAYADEVIALIEERIFQHIGYQEKIENFCGKTRLLDLVAIFQESDLLVTVDTGATHIAATTGIPMVTIYGCTSPKRWHPYNDRARVLSHEPECCPCKIGPEDCPTMPQPECLWQIKPEMVLAKCYELLDN